MFVYSLAIKRRKKGPMQPVRHVLITKEGGIAGDCRGGGEKQVTITSYEQWLEACDEIGTCLPTFERRAGICVKGYSFGSKDQGAQIVFSSGLILEIIKELKPCSRMDMIHPGLQKALEPNWRGGVACRVIVGGPLSVDDTFEIHFAD